MSERQLYLLSPYRLPTHHQVLLNEDEMSAWLHGWIALWHPAALLNGQAVPSIASCYEHESPSPGQIFAIPHAPQLFQPEDWPDRVRNSGALSFSCVDDRTRTLDNLFHALRTVEPAPEPDVFALLDLPMERVRPFFAIGFGYVMIDALFEAMDHPKLLNVEEFWFIVQNAVRALLQPDGHAEVETQLKLAAERLQSARETLYPIAMHLLDITLLNAKNLETPWPNAMAVGSPLNILASAEVLDQFREQQPERFQHLREALKADVVPPVLEVIGAIRTERPDSYLPVESQLWNLKSGRAKSYELLGQEVHVHARTTSASHPHVPAFLQHAGMRHSLLLNFDSAVIPTHRATVVNWSAPDGKYIDVFTRAPSPLHQPQTFFNLVYQLHQSITQDTAPTLAFLHKEGAPFPMYEDWLALSKLAPVLGTWTTFSRYFSDALAGEYAGAANADDFFNDDLEQRVNAHRPDPVSGFAKFARQRRKVDACWTFAAVHRVLSGSNEKMGRLEELEDKLELQGPDYIPSPEDPLDLDLTQTLSDWSKRMAERLQARSVEGKPGFLLLNPCAFARRIALEIDGISGPLPIEGPIKAAQFDSDKARLVVELPSLGFAWIPQSGPPGTTAPRSRFKLADGNMVRNEFFEAEVDATTGGLRAFRDPKTRINRLGQFLAYNPGSRMEADSVEVTMSGTALGELTTTGRILDDQRQVLAKFRQRFRAWAARPLLEIRAEIMPEHTATGYPWHAFYSMRFAWGDERAALFRGVAGSPAFTYHTRPVSPDYLEIRSGRKSTAIFTGGLPFHQRHGTRMLDVILMPEGEQCRTFDIGLALDRDHPMQAAQGMISPVGIVPTTKGPPSVGPSAWLFHNDAPNLLLLSMRPNPRVGAPDRSILAQFIETGAVGGAGQFRCVRNPSGARSVDGIGQSNMEMSVFEDAVNLDFTSGEVLRVEIDFA